MPIYNPPKQNNWGDALQVAGTTISAAGSIAGAATAVTGVGALAGGAIALGGQLVSGIGSLINQGQEQKQQEYAQTYKTQSQGEANLRTSINNNRELQRSREMIGSLSGINNM